MKLTKSAPSVWITKWLTWFWFVMVFWIITSAAFPVKERNVNVFVGEAPLIEGTEYREDFKNYNDSQNELW